MNDLFDIHQSAPIGIIEGKVLKTSIWNFMPMMSVMPFFDPQPHHRERGEQLRPWIVELGMHQAHGPVLAADLRPLCG
jgi:hypothetical protein